MSDEEDVMKKKKKKKKKKSCGKNKKINSGLPFLYRLLNNFTNIFFAVSLFFAIW